MKKAICILLAVLLLGTCAIPCGAVEAKPTGRTIYVDAKPVTCAAYEIEGETYFKLRDLAALFKDTSAEFSVEWDAATQTVVLDSKKKYAPVGGELQAAVGTDANAAITTHTLRIDGREVTNLTGFNVGGCNYYPLHRLSMWLYFETDLDKENNRIGIITTQMTGCELPFADFYGTQSEQPATETESTADRC